jgi:hypothetical protein
MMVFQYHRIARIGVVQCSRFEAGRFSIRILIGTAAILIESIIIIIIIIIIILTADGFLPGGSDTTIRHNTQITHITQNNTTHSNKTML